MNNEQGYDLQTAYGDDYVAAMASDRREALQASVVEHRRKAAEHRAAAEAAEFELALLSGWWATAWWLLTGRVG